MKKLEIINLIQVTLKDVSLYLNTRSKQKNETNLITNKKGLINLPSRFKRNKFIALDKINLTINRGDRIAVIGANGAGKSTLLRLLAGIYVPSEGEATIPKYALPLLDKSIITSGLLSAVSACRAHYYYIKARYGELKELVKDENDFVDKVIEFAGLDEFRDTPIIHYSDGMRARLIFSLYTAIKYPFIVVDESLGTTDINFTQKASKRFDEFIENSSILMLASHSEALLKKYCNQAIYLKNGQLKLKGSINEVLQFYKENLS